jgi:hypothetical protein
MRHLILKFNIREVFDIVNRHDIAETWLEVALNTITLTLLDIDRPGNISIVLYAYVDRWPVCCLSFDLRILIALLVSSSSTSNSYVFLCLKHQ